MALEHHVRLDGIRFAGLTWTESPATLLVDGDRVDARRLRAGDRWWALRGERAGIEITVVGRDWHPGTVAVETLADPTPMLDRLRTAPPLRPAAPSTRPAEPLSAAAQREPHRALVDAVLRHTAAQAVWQSEGGPPPELPASWSDLWRAAVRRQMDLSDRPESEAAEAVDGMTSQVIALFHDCAWFRDDGDLRHRAIAEILLHSTGLGPGVPSHAAQEAWQRQTADGDDRDTHAEWLTAWLTWARGR